MPALKTVTIPSSGVISGSNGHHEFQLVVAEESIDTNTNKSTMSYTFSIREKSGHSGYKWTGWGTSISYSVNIGDKTFTGYIPNYTADSNNWTTISSSSSGFTIDHLTDGTKTISISFNVSDTTGKSYTCGNASGSLSSWALTTIPRASTLSLSSSYILINSSNYSSGNLVCTVTNLTGKYTSLTWRVSGVKPDGTSATCAWQTPSTQPGTSQSKTINISFESILKAEKNIISNCVVEVLVTTYPNTTATGDPIGTNTSTCNYDITASSMKPNVSFNTNGGSAYVLTKNYRVTGSSGITVPVCGYCTLKPYGWTTSGWNSCTTVTKLTVSTTSPTNCPAATVTNFNVTRSGALNNSYTNNSSTVYGIISPVTTTYRDSYVLTIVLTVTDSRGMTNSATTTVTVYSYTPPTLSLQAKRVTINTNTSEVTEDAAGNYIIVKYLSILGSSLNSNNTVTNTCTCTIGNSTTTLPSGDTASSGWTPISWQSARWYYHTLDSTSSATVTLSTVDKIISTAITTNAYVSVAKYPLDLYDNGAGTVGVGLGTLAEAGYISLGLPLNTDINFTGKGAGNQNRIYWNESGWGDQFAIVPHFSGGDDSNVLAIMSAVGGSGTLPDVSDKVTIAGKTGKITSIGSIQAGIKANTDRERDLIVRSGAGELMLFSQASTTGDRGLYMGTQPTWVSGNTDKAATILRVDKDNNIQFEGEIKFVHLSYASTVADTASGIGCANKGSRYLINELLTDGIIAPHSAYSGTNRHSLNTAADTIRFYKYSGNSGGQWTGLTKTAEIDTNGLYRPKISKSHTISLTGISAYANSTTVLRFKVPIPPGYSSATLDASTVPSTAGAGSAAWTTTGGTIALMTGTNDQNFEVGYLNMTLTMSSATFTASRGCVFQNGSVTLKLS